MTRKGVFCLEGMWDLDLRNRSTVRPILELLHQAKDIPYIYRDCATTEELHYYLEKWPQKRYHRYPILYLAFHGLETGIRVGGMLFSLDDFAELFAGRCKKSIVMFGSCSTLATDKRHLKRFLDVTGALAICGYKNEVDWLRSTAFELLLISTLQENEFSGRGLSAIRRKTDQIARLFRDLDFRMVAVGE
jgi:hypothetical protein